MSEKAPYGYCPICKAEGINRTRCGQCASDTCENGHQYMAKDALHEVSPPGWSGTVKAMKKHKDIDNPFALAWSMKNKGDKAHYKPEPKDSSKSKKKPEKKEKYKMESFHEFLSRKIDEGDDWIGDAINPKHKGFCTPMTKKTCTSERKALAKRFKHGDIHADNEAKDEAAKA